MNESDVSTPKVIAIGKVTPNFDCSRKGDCSASIQGQGNQAYNILLIVSRPFLKSSVFHEDRPGNHLDGRWAFVQNSVPGPFERQHSIENQVLIEIETSLRIGNDNLELFCSQKRAARTNRSFAARSRIAGLAFWPGGERTRICWLRCFCRV